MGAVGPMGGLASGVFSRGTKLNDDGQIGFVKGYASMSLVLNAKNSNAIYKSINTVQPSAFQTLIIIKA